MLGSEVALADVVEVVDVKDELAFVFPEAVESSPFRKMTKANTSKTIRPAAPAPRAASRRRR
jgi:hypothetical protein